MCCFHAGLEDKTCAMLSGGDVLMRQMPAGLRPPVEVFGSEVGWGRGSSSLSLIC